MTFVGGEGSVSNLFPGKTLESHLCRFSPPLERARCPDAGPRGVATRTERSCPRPRLFRGFTEISGGSAQDRTWGHPGITRVCRGD